MSTSLTTRTATWANLGTSVEECPHNIDAILEEANLNYNVVKRPVSIDGVGISDKYSAIVRESDGHVYNIAKNSYTICQNRDAFAFLEEMPEDLSIIRAGETQSGMIYLIGEMPKIKILDDEFTPNLIFQTSHNSEFALKTAIIPLRIACQNQFNTAFGESNNSVTIRHTPGIATSVGEAGRILRGASEYMKDFAFQANFLAGNKINAEKAIQILLPISKEATAAQAQKVEEARDLFRAIYNNDDNQNFRGTAWGLMNAVTDYSTHSATKRGKEENKFVSSILYPDFQKKATRLILTGAIAA